MKITFKYNLGLIAIWGLSTAVWIYVLSYVLAHIRITYVF